MMEIYDVDYNKYVDIIGTAHFTRRSLADAYNAIKSLKPKDVALELDWRRFRTLNSACFSCPKKSVCSGMCEFIGATDALGNVDANIWLIDMTEQEINHRIKNMMSPYERSRIGLPIYYPEKENPIWLWENNFKDRVVKNEKKRIEALRNLFPSIWRVLIDERNLLMAARLAWIMSKNLDEGKTSKIITFVGAAHVEGISDHLSNPTKIKNNFKRFDLSFKEPTLIRRVAIQGILRS